MSKFTGRAKGSGGSGAGVFANAGQWTFYLACMASAILVILILVWGSLALMQVIGSTEDEDVTSTNAVAHDTAPPPATLQQFDRQSSEQLSSASAAVIEARRPQPPAAKQRVEERRRLVESLTRPYHGRRPIRDKRVLEAIRTVPRHVFVPPDMRQYAYRNTPLPIGYGQTISQPYMVAAMTDLLKLTPNSKVLEIGTGSGYQAAILAHLTEHVYTIEIIEPLAQAADRVLSEQGYDKIERRQGDGYLGWREAAAFDAIIVTCAAGHLPPPLWKQLKAGGRIVIPIGGVYEIQQLVVVEKTADGKRRSQAVMPVAFVPMTGQALSAGKR